MTDFGRRAPAGLIIKSIQSGIIEISNGDLINTAIIAAVDTSKSLLLLQGVKTTSGFVIWWMPTLSLTNPTTVTAQRNNVSDKVYARFTVIEFTAGIKSVQRGEITLDGVLSNTATINGVDTTRSVLFHLGQRSIWTGLNQVFAALILTNETTVTAERTIASGATLVAYEVLEFD